ncbi:hypothetical protein evm_015042 [Chilo suppressalis]|nr:hypothetical protein evm_015042 [Chilo suppressalis]
MSSNIVKCTGCNIVINEVLSFISNKIDVMDEESINRICLSAFTETEIVNAKNLLYDSISTAKGKKTRKRDGKRLRDIDDIIHLLKRTDPEEIPIFVARDLHKLPPVLFDHVDVTRLLKDIVLLKSEITEIKGDYASSNQLALLKADLECLKNAAVIDNFSCNVNMKKRGASRSENCDYVECNSSPIGLMPDSIEQEKRNNTLQLLSPQKEGVCEKSLETAAVANRRSSPPPPSQTGSMSHSKQLFDTTISNASEPLPVQAPITSCNSEQVQPIRTMADIARTGEWKKQQPSQEWILVQKHKLRNRFIGKRGAAITNSEINFKAAEVKVPLYVYNVSKNVNTSDIVSYIKNKTGLCACVEKNTMKLDKDYNGFKVFVPKHKLDIFMSDDFWPEGALRSMDCIRRLCQTADVIALQETWLLPHDIPSLGDINQDFAYTGKSAVDTSKGILRGRPYGGVAILWKKSSFPCVSVINCNSVRLAAVKMELHDKAVLLFSVYMPTDTNDNLIEFIECLSEINAIIENSDVQSVYILGDFNAHPDAAVTSNNYSKRKWKYKISWNNLSGKVSLPVSVAGCHEPLEIAEAFSRSFRVQSSLGAWLPELNAECQNALPSDRFSAKEVAFVIKNMTRGKSPGHDGLSVEHLQNGGVHLPRVLAMFFLLCLNHSYLPNKLTYTIVTPIVKNKTGDISELSNYRPISLAIVIAKVLDSLLDKRLNKHLHLHDAQFGFKSGLSTESAIFCLKQTVQYYTA